MMIFQNSISQLSPKLTGLLLMVIFNFELYLDVGCMSPYTAIGSHLYVYFLRDIPTASPLVGGGEGTH